MNTLLYLSKVQGGFRMVSFECGGGGLVAKSCPTLATPWILACQDLCPWGSPVKNTGVGCRSPLDSWHLNYGFNSTGIKPGVSGYTQECIILCIIQSHQHDTN